MLRSALAAASGALALFGVVPPASAAPVPPAGFLVGTDGELYTASPDGRGGWTGPAPASPKGLAPAGAGVAAVRMPDGNLAAFYVGTDGVPRVSHTGGSGQWQPPVAYRWASKIDPGAQVAAVATPTGANAFVVDRAGRLYVADVTIHVPMWYMGVPAGPFGLFASGSRLSAVRTAKGELWVTGIGASGALTALRTDASGAWQDPVPLTDKGVATPGATVRSIVTSGGVIIIIWIDGNGRVHIVVVQPDPPPDEPRPIDWVLRDIDPLGATADLAPVVLPDGQVAVFFTARDGAVNLVRLGSEGREQLGGPVRVTDPGSLPAGAPLAVAVTGASSAGYDFDGEFCGTPPRWPPRWGRLHFSVDPAGRVSGTQISTFGPNLTVPGGNIALTG